MVEVVTQWLLVASSFGGIYVSVKAEWDSTIFGIRWVESRRNTTVRTHGHLDLGNLSGVHVQ